MAQQADLDEYLDLKPIGLVAFKTTDILVKDTKRGLIYGVGYVLASTKPEFKPPRGPKSDAASNNSSQNAIKRASKAKPSPFGNRIHLSAAAKSTSHTQASPGKEQVKILSEKANASSKPDNHSETIPPPIMNDALNKHNTKDSIRSVTSNSNLTPRTPDAKVSAKNKGKGKAEPTSLIRGQFNSSPPIVSLNPEPRSDYGTNNNDIFKTQRSDPKTTTESPPGTIVSATELQNPFIGITTTQPLEIKQSTASQPLRSRFKALARLRGKVEGPLGEASEEEQELSQESLSPPLSLPPPRASKVQSDRINIPSEVPALGNRLDILSKPKVDMTLRNIFLQRKQQEKDLTQSRKQQTFVNEEATKKPYPIVSQSEMCGVSDSERQSGGSDKTQSHTDQKPSSDEPLSKITTSLDDQTISTSEPLNPSLDLEEIKINEPATILPVLLALNSAQVQEQIGDGNAAQITVADDVFLTTKPTNTAVADDARDSSEVTSRVTVKNAVDQQTSITHPSTLTKYPMPPETASAASKAPVVAQFLPTQEISITEENIEQDTEPFRTSSSQPFASKNQAEKETPGIGISLDGSEIGTAVVAIDKSSASVTRPVSGLQKNVGESIVAQESDMQQSSQASAMSELETTPKAKVTKIAPAESIFTEPETVATGTKDANIGAEALKPQAQAPEVQAESAQVELDTKSTKERDTTPRAKRISIPVQTEDRSYSSLSWSDDNEGLSPAMSNREAFQTSQSQVDAGAPRISASTPMRTDLVPSIPSTNTLDESIWKPNRATQSQSANSSRPGTGQSQRVIASPSGEDSRSSSGQSQHAKTLTPRSKVLCRNVQMNKSCQLRNQCPYSHDKSTGICYYYSKDNCRFGKNCAFRHDSTQNSQSSVLGAGPSTFASFSVFSGKKQPPEWLQDEKYKGDSQSSVLSAETSTPVSSLEAGGMKQLPKWLQEVMEKSPVGNTTDLLPPVDNDLLHGSGWREKFAQAGFTVEDEDDQSLDGGVQSASSSGREFPEGMQHSRWAIPSDTEPSVEPPSGKDKEFPEGMQHSRWATSTTIPSKEQATSGTTAQTMSAQATPIAPNPAVSGGDISQSIYATDEPASSSSKETPALSKTTAQNKPATSKKGPLSGGMSSSRWA